MKPLADRVQTVVRTLAVLCGISCAWSIPIIGQVEVSDSAGVRLVTSHRPVWGSESRWYVSPHPRLTVGVVEGDPVYQFRYIRAAILDASQRLTVVDSDSPMLRQYDAQGIHIRSTGREGRGPGEFRVPLRLVRDSVGQLLVWDAVQRRITWFTADLEVVRTERLTGPRAFHVGALLPNGWRVMPVFYQAVQPTQAGPWRPTAPLVLLAPNAAAGDTLMEYRGAEMMARADGTARSYAFPRKTIVTAGGSPLRIVVGDTETFDIAVFSSHGTLTMRVRRSSRLQRVTREDVARFRRDQLAALEGVPNEQFWRRRLADVSGPPTFPAFADLHVDSGGHLWVQEYHPFEPMKRLFAVFDSDGRWLGEVVLPDNLNVLSIGVDYLVGWTPDGLDTPSVGVYDLIREHE